MSDSSPGRKAKSIFSMLNTHDCGVACASETTALLSSGTASHCEQIETPKTQEVVADSSCPSTLVRQRGNWVVHHKHRNIRAWNGALNRDVTPTESTTAQDVLHGKRLVRELTVGRVNNPRHRTVVSAQCQWRPRGSLGRDVGTWRVVRLASALFGHSRDQRLIVTRPGI